MVKRVLTVGGAMVLACSSLWVGTAAAQDDDTTATTPTTAAVEEETTPTTAPDDAAGDEGAVDEGAGDDETTTTAPADDETTTTVAEEDDTTDEAPAIIGLPVQLPGELVAAGSLDIDVRFADAPLSNCITSVPLAGGQVNVGRSGGSIGGVYGIAPSGTGHAGVYMVGLGAIPAGVGIVSVSNGSCEFDAIGIGAYSSTASRARLAGVGAGVHPGAYADGDYVSSFVVEANVEATQGPALLDLAGATSFLLRDRPGLAIGG